MTDVPTNSVDIEGWLCTCKHALATHYLAPPNVPCKVCDCKQYTFKDRTHLYNTAPPPPTKPQWDVSSQQAIVNNAAELMRRLPTRVTPRVAAAYARKECARYDATEEQIEETVRLVVDHVRLVANHTRAR